MIQHILITRFSYRGNNLDRKKGQDPLDKKNLDHRFGLFEIACLPSILNQKNQDFTWVLVVDPELPSKYRNRLQKLISPKKESYLVDFRPGLVIHKLTWLKPWIKNDTKYLVNTVLDDDDMLFDGFTQYISDYLGQKQPLEPITFFACSNEFSWDFYATKRSPFGCLKSKKKHNFPPGAGLAVCCKYPEINFSIMSFEHNLFDYLSTESMGFNDLSQLKKTRVEYLRKMIAEEIDKSNLDWEGRLTGKNFHYISSETTQIITINHFDNIQFTRIFTNSERRKPVDPGNFVQGFVVDFQLVAKHLSKYRKSFWLLIKLIKSNFKITPNFLLTEGKLKLLIYRIVNVKKIIAGYMKMK